MDSDDQNSGVTMECMTGSDNDATKRFMKGSRRSGSLTTLDFTTRQCSVSDGLRMSKEKTGFSLP